MKDGDMAHLEGLAILLEGGVGVGPDISGKLPSRQSLRGLEALTFAARLSPAFLKRCHR